MRAVNCFAKKIMLTVLVAVSSAISVVAQLPIPIPGQRPARDDSQGGVPGSATSGRSIGRGGRGAPAAPAEPVKPVVTPIPASREVTSPGEFYETFMDDHDDETNANITAKDIYAKFNYEAKESFISGETWARNPDLDARRTRCRK